MGTACLCHHVVFGGVAGRVGVAAKAGSWNHLKACSLMCLVVNTGCWQGPQPGHPAKHLHMTSPFGCLVSSQHGGWVPREESIVKFHGIFDLVLEFA